MVNIKNKDSIHGYLTALSIDTTNHPILCYNAANIAIKYNSNITSTTVSRFNGANWEYIGDTSINSGDAINSDISLTSNNHLYCAYINSNAGLKNGEVFVKRNFDLPTDVVPDTSVYVSPTLLHRSDNLTIYPTPCKDYFQIEGLDKNRINTIYVYDLSGKLFEKLQLRSKKVNTQYWPNGIYIIETEYGEQAKVLKTN